MASIIHWLENHLMPCFYKKYLGVDCPGCGMQRSIVELFKGNIISSFELYPALIPVFFTLTVTFLHILFKFKNGAAVIKYSFIITMIIIIFSYLFKLLT